MPSALSRCQERTLIRRLGAVAACLLGAGALQLADEPVGQDGATLVEHDGALVPVDRLPPHLFVVEGAPDAAERQQEQRGSSRPATARCSPAPPKVLRPPECSIALLIPTVGGRFTRGLFEHVFSSIADTASSECRLGLFLAYDYPGDDFYRRNESKPQIEAIFRNVVPESKQAWIKLHWAVNTADRSYNTAINAAAWAAHAAGFNYFYQTGDDVAFDRDSKNWDIVFAKQINDLDGFGMTGGQEKRQLSLHYQERAFVGRSHMCVFGTFFPLEFRNIYTGNWITSVYSTLGRYTSNEDVRMKNLQTGVAHRYPSAWEQTETWQRLVGKYVDWAESGGSCDPGRFACQTRPESEGQSWNRTSASAVARVARFDP